MRSLKHAGTHYNCINNNIIAIHSAGREVNLKDVLYAEGNNRVTRMKNRKKKKTGRRRVPARDDLYTRNTVFRVFR